MRVIPTALGALAAAGLSHATTPRPGFVSRIRSSNQVEADDFITTYLGLVMRPSTNETVTSEAESPKVPGVNSTTQGDAPTSEDVPTVQITESSPTPDDPATERKDGAEPPIDMFRFGNVPDDAKVPIWDLPSCYQKCFYSECCNGRFGDVHDLTKHQFCESKRFLVGHWMLEHVQFCIGNNCRECGDVCRDDSTKWLLDLCGHGM